MYYLENLQKQWVWSNNIEAQFTVNVFVWHPVC